MSEQQTARPAAATPAAEPEPEEVAGLLAAVRQRYPGIDDRDAETLRGVLAQHRRMARSLRKYPLTNGDEPDLSFAAVARD